MDFSLALPATHVGLVIRYCLNDLGLSKAETADVLHDASIAATGIARLFERADFSLSPSDPSADRAEIEGIQRSSPVIDSSSSSV